MWMHEHYMWGFGWLFPLFGILLFAVLIILLTRAFSGGTSSASRLEIEEMRREMRELKEEIERLKKQGN